MHRRLSLLVLATLLFATTRGAAQGNPATRSIAFSTTEGTWLSLDVSPDSRRIVFELLGDLYDMPITGGTARRLLAGPAFESQPRYAPDGRHLLYVSDASGADNVWIANADGTSPRPLTTRRHGAMASPSWSPDGSAVLVTMIDGAFARSADVYKVDVATGAETRVVENANGAAAPLVSTPAPGAFGPIYSTDGTEIWFTSVTPRPYGSRNGGTTTVLHRALAGGAAQRVVLEGTNPMKPALSRDGRWLVYAAGYEGATGLRVRDLRDGSERWLHRGLQRNQLEARADRDLLPNYAITPDGQSVIIEIDGRIHRLGISDGSDVVIPFAVQVAMELPTAPSFSLRVDTGAVRARRIQHVALRADGRVAFSTLARIFVTGGSGAPRRLTRTERPREFMPAWSPDGQWIAFITWDESGGALWKARVDGKGAPIKLSTAPAFWADPVWSADGATVLAFTAPLGGSRLAPSVVPPDAQMVRVVATGASIGTVSPATGVKSARAGRKPSSADAPFDATAVAWADDGAPVAWARGMTLFRARAGGALDTLRLDVSVSRPRPSGSLVLRGATVLTMRGDETVPQADVVVSGDRIVGVGRRGSVPVPADAHIIDVTGKTIVPGFIDVHAHLAPRQELLEPEATNTFASLAYGVTTVRDPQVAADIFDIAEIVEADAVPAPRIYSTGPLIGLSPNFGTRDFQSLDDVRRAVATYRDDYGTHYLKSYLAGNRQQRQWIAQASREAGILATTEGGADTKEDLTHALDGYSGNEHALPVAPLHNDVIQFYAQSGIFYTPTLVVSFGGALPIYRLLAEERPHQQRVAQWYADGEMYQRGATRLLAFSDEDYNDRDTGAGAAAILRAGGNVALGGHGEVHGLSAHWEMQLMANAGMTPREVLRVATINGARALGLDADLGSLEIGKLADLVVLDRDPLADIRNTTATRYVMRSGRLYDAESLDEMAPRTTVRAVPWWMARQATQLTVSQRVDRVVARLMAQMNVPGVGVGVMRGGEVLVAKGYGVSNVELRSPATDRTLFQSGSLGKQFTAAGVMALVEDGKIRLDASVRTYLKDAPLAWQDVTIRHLLTQLSGIPDYTSDQMNYRKSYTEQDLKQMAYAMPLEYPPGARWNYSNTGYVLLGIIIHEVSGKPYWDFLRERIFAPAGMPTVRVISESAIIPDRASSYLPAPDGIRNQDWVSPELNTTADGSMLMSVQDMIAWNDVVRRRAVLSAESWAAILSPVTLKSGKPYPYGMGWMLDSLNGKQVAQHGGAWQGFRTQYSRFEQGDLAVVVLANARTAATDIFANEIAAAVDPALRAPPLPAQPIPDREPANTQKVRAALMKAAHNELALSDFTSVRQTTFPRLQALLARVLSGLDAPDSLALLRRSEVGDDIAYVYRASYGVKRFIVNVNFGPDGRLSWLLLAPDAP